METKCGTGAKCEKYCPLMKLGLMVPGRNCPDPIALIEEFLATELTPAA